ncbi:hypothetical protein V6N13_053547 [Hibiscus sabdariffa]
MKSSSVMMRIGTTRTQSLQTQRIPGVSFHASFNSFSTCLYKCGLVLSITKFLRFIIFHSCGRNGSCFCQLALNNEVGRRICSMGTLFSLQLQLLGEVVLMDEANGLQ